ncbi:hypothetical protein IFR05_010620, partial [Cadophora sp. M221]
DQDQYQEQDLGQDHDQDYDQDQDQEKSEVKKVKVRIARDHWLPTDRPSLHHLPLPTAHRPGQGVRRLA